MSFGPLLLSPRTVSEKVSLALAGVGAVAAACVSYGIFVEPRWYRRRSYRLEVLPAGSSRSLTILHLSDLHFRPDDQAKARFLASLGQPDLVVVTGDIIGEPSSVEVAVDSLRPVRGRLASFFVLGSNDYFTPKPLNYLAYFRGPRRRRKGTRNRTADLIAQLEQDGWVHLKNVKTAVAQGGFRSEVLGMDDPHIERHDLRAATRADPTAFGLALVHSPDPAPELAALGYQLIVSGHTHGGQVRLPFVGALVTNSQLPTRLAMGLSRMGPALLHVSPGLGTSKFAPFRFLCRPEATVLELVPAASDRAGANGQRSATGAAAAPATARSKTRS
jgi:predicted MPP superfamily phosphohydrolase